MNFIKKIVEYDEAADDVRLIYDETMRDLNIPFVLNWFKCQGNNSTLLRGNWEKLRSTMLVGNVPFILKQLIIYNISTIKGCSYCSHAHGAIANGMSKMLTGSSEIKVTDNLGSDYIPSAYKTAIKIVTSLALTPRAASSQDYENLYDEGFSDLDIQELLSLADLTNMVNTIADISGIPIDNELMEAM
ncbi:carboxymuconolactone decarboxylase family protein [Mucilaginibacter sp. UYCu711]|uniref:carboxymuconolactone decarboxylase family protein n=1 Tax=Mucilaginibacter sp. UYCu711 TaxID=3156339 RepID=UPI003D1BAB13